MASKTGAADRDGKTVAGLNMVAVRVDRVEPNPWNPNQMNEETFQKELRSIREHGFIDPITVRELPEKPGWWQIIDGEHRWKAAKELGIKEIPATNLGPISDHQAKKLTIIYNELRGTPEPVKLAKVLEDLAEQQSVQELALDLPMQAVEIDSLIKSVKPFNWEESLSHSQLPDQDKTRPQGQTGAEERKFAMGNVRGNLPLWLLEKLMAEFDRSARSVRTRNPEFVLRDWLDRLAQVAPKDEEAAKAAEAQDAAARAAKASKPRKSKGASKKAKEDATNGQDHEEA